MGVRLFAFDKSSPERLHTPRQHILSGSKLVRMGLVLRIYKDRNLPHQYYLDVQWYVAPRDPQLEVSNCAQVTPSPNMCSQAGCPTSSPLARLFVETHAMYLCPA